MKISKSPVKKVPLSTKGELSIYFIGCGSAFAKTLKQNNILVAKGDRNILIDCGGTCSQSLYEVGVSLPEIDTYLITHSHADHIGGLEEVHMMGRYVLNKKPTMIINKAYEKILWEQSLRGGSELSEKEAGKKVVLSGWLHRKRDHGNLLFIDLRDNYGITQCLIDRDNLNFKELEKTQLETVVQFMGKVVSRSDETVNNDIKTGEIEVSIQDFKILGKCKELPMPIFSDPLRCPYPACLPINTQLPALVIEYPH